MQRIRALIRARSDKIADMEKRFEPSERIAQYKQVSRQVIIEDYKKTVQGMQAANQGKMSAIVNEYGKKAPTQHERAEALTIIKNDLRSMSIKQLQEIASRYQAVPPGIFSADDMRSLASELRDRGDEDTADRLASYIQIRHIDFPYRNDERYQGLEKINARYDVFLAQSSRSLVLSSDPLKIGKDDVVDLNPLNGKVKA